MFLCPDLMRETADDAESLNSLLCVMAWPRRAPVAPGTPRATSFNACSVVCNALPVRPCARVSTNANRALGVWARITVAYPTDHRPPRRPGPPMRAPLPLAVCAAVLVSACAILPPAQKRALQDVFDAMNGPHWVMWRGPWDFATDPCEFLWLGVTCNAGNTTIVYVPPCGARARARGCRNRPAPRSGSVPTPRAGSCRCRA